MFVEPKIYALIEQKMSLYFMHHMQESMKLFLIAVNEIKGERSREPNLLWIQLSSGASAT